MLPAVGGAWTAVALWAFGWILVFLGLVTGLVAPDFILGEVLPAVGGLLTAIFGLVTGIVVGRAGVWRGWPQWIPLTLAVYVIVALFIPLFMGIEPSLFTEAGWALGFVVLGAALRTATPSGQR